MFLLSVVNRGFKPWSHQTKDNKIKFHYFSAKYAALRSNNKDLLAQNQDNVSEYSHGHIKPDNKIKFHYFSAKYAALKSNNKDLLAQNQDNVSEYSHGHIKPKTIKLNFITSPLSTQH